MRKHATATRSGNMLPRKCFEIRWYEIGSETIFDAFCRPDERVLHA